MGIGSSIPTSAELTRHIKYQGKTIPIEKTLNDIFKWMLENSDILDYYALASPSECKLYTKSTEEGLTKWFKLLQVQPSEDNKSGKIYFQRTAELEEIAKSSTQITDEKYKAISQPTQRRLCMQIAHFYLRVLQIYSALALSVLDTGVPSDYETMVAVKEAEKKGKPAGAIRQPSNFYRVPLDPQQGGEPPYGYYRSDVAKTKIQNPNYDILNPYLSYSSVQPQVVEIVDGVKRTGIFILTSLIEKLNKNEIRVLILTSTLKDKDDETVRLGATLVIERRVESASNSKYGVGTTFSYNVLLDELTRKDKKIPEEELRGLNLGPLNFKLQGTEFRYNNQNIAQWINGSFRKILGFDEVEEKTEGGISRRAARKSVEGLPSDFPEATFGVQTIARILKKGKPKAYCVSRAIQLLSPEQFYKDMDIPAKTRICNSSFAFPDSSPVLTKQIGEVKGLFFLNQLFYDKIVASSPAISEQLLPQHQAFMNDLKALYEQQTTAVKEKADFGSIVEQPASFCKTKGKAAVYQTKDKETIRNLKEYVGRLLRRQMEHTSNVMKLLLELFIVDDPVTPLKLQPSVWKKGMPEVERIAGRARELLMAYYTDCETTYQEATLYIAKRADKFEL